jgi:hypothetical protein
MSLVNELKPKQTNRRNDFSRKTVFSPDRITDSIELDGNDNTDEVPERNVVIQET